MFSFKCFIQVCKLQITFPIHVSKDSTFPFIRFMYSFFWIKLSALPMQQLACCSSPGGLKLTAESRFGLGVSVVAWCCRAVNEELCSAVWARITVGPRRRPTHQWLVWWNERWTAAGCWGDAWRILFYVYPLRL